MSKNLPDANESKEKSTMGWGKPLAIAGLIGGATLLFGGGGALLGGGLGKAIMFFGAVAAFAGVAMHFSKEPKSSETKELTTVDSKANRNVDQKVEEHAKQRQKEGEGPDKNTKLEEQDVSKTKGIGNALKEGGVEMTSDNMGSNTGVVKNQKPGREK